METCDLRITAKFKTYRFVDYKKFFVTLLAEMVHVSVETVAITKAIAALNRNGWKS